MVKFIWNLKAYQIGLGVGGVKLDFHIQITNQK